MTQSRDLLDSRQPGRRGPYESAEAHDKLYRIAAEKELPVYASMQGTAASGGYYISAGADKIYATAETTTGSIGVIMQAIEYSGLLEKLGIEYNTIKSGTLKDIGSPDRDMTEEERALLQAYVDETISVSSLSFQREGICRKKRSALLRMA